MQLQVSRISRGECSAEEWEARVDLAAAHRLAVMLLAGKQVQRA